MSESISTKSSVLRALPSVDELLRSKEAQILRRSVGTQRMTALARSVTADLRLSFKAGPPDGHARPLKKLANQFWVKPFAGLKTLAGLTSLTGSGRVINATGVILHTNLGRAPLSEAAREALANDAAGYCALEYDVTTGERGRRGGRVEDLLSELTGAEEALVVNNCAAAALLVLTVLAGDGETIVSRGELGRNWRRLSRT